MNNTYQILLHWDKGQPFAERLSGKILSFEGFYDIDPQSPTGGPDGTKDILCKKDNLTYIAACYFPSGTKSFSDIQKKIKDDYKGFTKHKPSGFIFLTNQKISPTERIILIQKFPKSDFYHGEKICNILDSPKGYGARLEYLGIELSKEEQLSFLDSYLNLQNEFSEIKMILSEIRKTPNEIAGQINPETLHRNPLYCIPIAGLDFSAKISFEDLFGILEACLYEEKSAPKTISRTFRSVDVWVGLPGREKEEADFIPTKPSEIPKEIRNLLEWWRQEYQIILFASEKEKIYAIAEFHERFLSIHPFLDGNGRVARVISTIQIKDLLTSHLKNA